MKKIIFVISLCLFLQVVYANDSGVIGVGGSWVLLKGEHPTVQMERETIEINVYKEYYDVVAVFTFKNNGDACDVYMGFPESGGGDMGSYNDSLTAFLKFSTSVNGITVEAKRERVKIDDEMEYKAYWIKQVSFKEGETKKIVVKYRSPLGSGISAVENTSDDFVSYSFTGGNWQGKVLESKVNIYFHIDADVRMSQTKDLQKELDHYSYTRTNWEAEDYLKVEFKNKEKFKEQ